MSTRRFLVLITFGVGSIILLLLMALLTTEVLAPLEDVIEMAAALAKGDLYPRVRIRGAAEMRALARAINDAAARLSVAKSALEEEVRRRTQELSMANARLEHLVITDPLTQLFNRRYLEQTMDAELRRQRRAGHPFAIMMIDVDHFKHYNDTHGHPEGDTLLKDLAQVLRENVRSSDVVARIGGEEFVVVLLDTNIEQATAASENLRLAIEKHRFVHGDEQPLGKLTVSAGVAVWPQHASSTKALIEAADAALYRAKNGGRNRVCMAAGLSS